jgi:dihydroflavonol-4-reductase
MKILLTGATGLLGNNVARALLTAKQHELRLLVRRRDDKSLAGLDAELALGDVRDRQAVERAAEGCQAIIHSAAGVHLGWKKLEEHRGINVEGTRHIVEAAQKNNARLMYVSTVDTLGLGSPSAPADEESPKEGKILCTYVRTKREAEAVVQEAMPLGLDAVVIHPGFMLGPWDWKPSSGRMLLAVARSFTPAAPHGGCSACDVRDVADGVIAALEKAPRGRHYILAGHNIPYYDLWKKMAALTDGRPPFMRDGPLIRLIAGAIGDLYANVTGHEGDVNSATIKMGRQYHYYTSARAEQELGYRIRPLDESILAAWEWFQEYGYVT